MYAIFAVIKILATTIAYKLFIMNLQQVKQRYGIIGNSEKLNRAIDIAMQVAGTDLTVLITGESGTGKEIFPQLIHQNSPRKHGTFIPVNCGAIPEGTIDSELFGHEKGAFTGASDHRKGYFEVAHQGTIFLDEVADLPLSTQVRLLRILESGEFIKVGSSKVLKTDVRVIAASNVALPQAIKEGKFREDLYYRLNSVPIYIPPLRERKEDIALLFAKFSQDFADRYKMPPIQLSDDARAILLNYRWYGNVRQLKNITEQLSVIEQDRYITAEKLKTYLPDYGNVSVPALYNQQEKDQKNFSTEREILYKFLIDMKKDMNDLKKLVKEVLQKDPDTMNFTPKNTDFIDSIYNQQSNYSPENYDAQDTGTPQNSQPRSLPDKNHEELNIQDTEEFVEESLSLEEKEIELIKKALEKHNGKRKYAAKDLGISERTLYRKIKEYNIN